MRVLKSWASAVCTVLALTGCGGAGDPTGSGDVGEAEGEWGWNPGVILSQASTLTFYADANFTGASYTVPLTATTNENILPITKTDIEAHGLLNGISSVRLSCGTHAANVTLFDGWNTGTSLASWSPSGNGISLGCEPFQLVQVDLLTQAPELHDKVGSAYFVNHANVAVRQPFASLLKTNWKKSIKSSLPSGATVQGDPIIQLTGVSTFTLRQNLVIDPTDGLSKICGAHSAHFVLMGWLNQADRSFTVSVQSTYVDTGWGDSFGCREGIQKGLKSGASKAAKLLDPQLESMVAQLVGTHPRYYFYPGTNLADFDVAGGGDDTTPVLNPNP